MNAGGKSITDFPLKTYQYLTLFKKTYNQYITHKLEKRENQTDFLLYRRNYLKEVKSFEGDKRRENVSAQHRLVVADCEFRCAKGGKQERPGNKWWKLNDVTVRNQLKTELMRELKSKQDTNE